MTEPNFPVVALIWRTVDVERTLATMGLSGVPIDDEVLGGRGVLVRPTEGPAVAVIEPSTEGRLAAALARDDEGESGAYIAPAGGVEEALTAGFTLLAEGRGPFGSSSLVGLPGERRSSDFHIVVPPGAATIAE